MDIGPWEIGLILLAVLLLFGYKKLPDASRSIGRSLRIFKGEMKGLKDDDVRGEESATPSPVVRGEVALPTADDPSEQLEAQARAAELRAAELRARAEQARSGANRSAG